MSDRMSSFDCQEPVEGCRPELRTTLQCLFTWREPIEVDCSFRYSVDDPYAVSIDLRLVPGISVTWVVARDLLEEGTRLASGEGDFRAWCSPGPQRSDRRLYFTLDRPDGRATFQANLHEVRRWLCSTYELVPAGSESELIDWHAWEASLLG
ncbi:SsgA family sporulation/cell division regulator [Streptomyces sp. NPDC057694]|uniref:SsgA family sporulation/cell division regulator n=1 Tax=Streptomyces sp. NPDC057694 TaxID=3346216 RepID=UPI00367A2ACE